MAFLCQTALSILTILMLHGCEERTSAQLIYGFHTKNGKEVGMFHDTTNQVLIFRIGNAEIPEVEVIDNLRDKIPVFVYSGYFRGGGMVNEGLDLKYLTFSSGGKQYTLFEEFAAESDQTYNGIRMQERNVVREVEWIAIPISVQGSLYDLVRKNLLPDDSDQ